MSAEDNYWERKAKREAEGEATERFFMTCLKIFAGCGITVAVCGVVAVVVKTVQFLLH